MCLETYIAWIKGKEEDSLLPEVWAGARPRVTSRAKETASNGMKSESKENPSKRERWMDTMLLILSIYLA